MTRAKVFLTGASGFLGSHVAAQLLDSGYAIKASFRTKSKAQDFKNAFAYKGTDIETHIIPDITASGAYDGAMDGCNFVVHCASPYTFAIKNIQADLIDPAVKGTAELLRAIAACPTIKRLVLTSSFASVIDPSKGQRPNYVYTEDDWNPITPVGALESNLSGYQASKTFAEKAAWEFAESHPNVSLVTICPPMIFGPSHPASGISLANPNESSAQLLNAIRNEGPAMLTRMPVFVDVRDVASIHVMALDLRSLPQSERLNVCGGKFTWAAIRDVFRNGSASPQSLVAADDFYLIGCDKVERLLGIEWRSLEASVLDCVKSLGFALSKSVI